MTLCLNMIVRDEAHIIEKTLRNVCDAFPIDRWVISDTGSVDGTQDIIRRTFSELNIPGVLHQHDWQNFAHNRNLALKECLGASDYILFFDADDAVEGVPVLPALTCDAYHVKIESEDRSSQYVRPLLVKNVPDLKWRGVVHEFIVIPGRDIGRIEGEYAVRSNRNGARSMDPEKYKKDALLLENALRSDADKDLQARYAFYCANSWRDYGDKDRALKWYLARTKLTGWREETYMAFLGAALQLEQRDRSDLALNFLLRGYDIVNDRAECLYHLSRILRHRGNFHAALIFAKAAASTPLPTGNRLFLRKNIYEYWVSYEVLFLTARIGEDPRLLSQYEPFMASAAPETTKDSIRALL